MRHCLFAVLVLGVSLLPLRAAAGESSDHWIVTGSDRAHYTVQGSGDLLGKGGATVTVRAADPAPGKFGGSLLTLDAAPYRGRTLVLSADLATHDVSRNAMLWLRADGQPGPPLAFANSAEMPVGGTTSGAHREVAIDVPTATTRIVLGTVLNGSGEVVATHLRLVSQPYQSHGTTAAAMLDAAIRIVRAHALHADRLDWSELDPRLHAMIDHTQLPMDAHAAIRVLLASLQDHHSHLLPPSLAKQEATGGMPSRPVVVEAQPGGIGYIDMPGYSGMQAAPRRAFITRVLDGIDQVQGRARCGWVVDLRHDPGGSMLPMLAGLRPLLGDDVLGGFRHAQGTVTPLHAMSPLDKDLPHGPSLQHARVAVLLGPHTASSGEVVAVAFHGRPRTRSFGQSTAGLSTGNSIYRLPDGSAIALTTAVDVDRHGQVYGGRIEPDQLVEATTTTTADATLDAARAWLVSTCDATAQRPTEDAAP